MNTYDKLEIVKEDILTCVNCGGTIDSSTLKCPYCDTQYKIKNSTSYYNKNIPRLDTILNYKGVKKTASALPISDNKKGDVWTVEDTSLNYIWPLDNSKATHNTVGWEALGVAEKGFGKPLIIWQ